MKNILGTLMAGMIIVVPLALTVYLVIAMGGWLDDLGTGVIQMAWPDAKIPTGLGAAAIIVGIYLIGLATRVWAFKWIFSVFERLILRVPGIKTIYESLRDLLKLFGGDSKKMGRVVRYNPPGTGISLLGIMTNDHPVAMADDSGEMKVAIYLPYAYMFGGPTIFVPPEHIRNVNMSVEQCLKLATTAHVGPSALPGPAITETATDGKKEKQNN